MDVKQVIYGLHPLARRVLPFVHLQDASLIVQQSSLNIDEVMVGLDMLLALGLITCEKSDEPYVGLDVLGKTYARKDLPEIVFLKKVLSGARTKETIGLDGAEFSSALGFLKRENLLTIEKGVAPTFVATSLAKEFLQSYKNPLGFYSADVPVQKLSAQQKEEVLTLKKRGLVREFTKKNIVATLTKEGKQVTFALQHEFANVELVDALTVDMLKTGAWKQASFRHYDVQVPVPSMSTGRRHPMMEANNILRDIFVEMGFMEMEGPMVESAFWNMDVMWIPQDHPARDEQDTFYLDGKAKLPPALVAKCKKMHEHGLKRSHTLPGDWSEDVARKRLLRAHSTATSFRVLARLAQEAGKKEIANGKYFYCAENFRNEAVDATHLNDFFQAEGFIVGDDLSLADLMGFVQEFYAKLGIHKIRFKPTYNPYTEPSMEAHYYDEVLGKWYALINSGVFRAETLEPLGIKKTIIAWGMGASRVAALLARKESMRDITGLTCDFAWLMHRPMMQREIVRK